MDLLNRLFQEIIKFSVELIKLLPLMIFCSDLNFNPQRGVPFSECAP